MQKKILIVGYGIFGKLMVDILSKDFQIYIHNRSKINKINIKFGGNIQNIKILDRDDDLKIKKDKFPFFDYVIFSVPVQFLKDSVEELGNFISEKTVILDVSSVKIYPLKIIENKFPKNQIIGTHPMFGVPSIEKKLDNLKVVISNVSGSNYENEKIIKYIKSIGFGIYKMSADEHDKRMAKVQALTHFIGEGLKSFDLRDDELKTYSYRIMYSLHIDTSLNTKELFETIQKFNPYAKNIRKKLISELIKIDRNL